MLMSYAEALRRPPPQTPNQLKNFNINHTNELFRRIKNYDGNDPLTVVRQFSCRACSKMWWKRVRTTKQVSKCKRCYKKYDPIPVDLEFGCGQFECICGNRFIGRIQMGHLSPCFQCRVPCLPKYIINRRDDDRIRVHSLNRHHCEKCNGIGNCPNYSHILAFSQLHESTGSTLASLANQSDLEERFIDDFANNDMPLIRESSTDDDDSSYNLD